VRTRLARAAGFSAINEADIEPTVLLDEIGALPPSLQLTAALLLAERWTRREICERLGISRVRLRKRIERIGKHLETRRRSSKDYR
jgi:DNA-directed RNA polymerase specialized sigma24 family protein